MAYAALGKDRERASFADYVDAHPTSGPGKDLTSYEREAMDHVMHAADAVVIPIYALVPLTEYQSERILKEVQEPDYAEPTGMKFKLVKWKGSGARKLDEREIEVEMLKVARRKGKGLLVFADEGTVVGEGVRVSDYEIWDDGWGDETPAGGLKGEGLKYGRVGCGDVLRIYMDVEVGSVDLEKVIVGGKKAAKIIRWGRLEQF